VWVLMMGVLMWVKCIPSAMCQNQTLLMVTVQTTMAVMVVFMVLGQGESLGVSRNVMAPLLASMFALRVRKQLLVYWRGR